MIVTLGQHEAMDRDLDQLHSIYESLGVKVVRLPSETTDAVFHRDVAAWTPFGHIKPGLMGKESRRWEPSVWFSATKQWARYTVPEGFFEGADLMWVTSRHCVLAVGPRTNEVGAKRIQDYLEFLGIEVTLVYLPEWHDQHLLGICNVVRGWTVFVDDEAVPEVPPEGWLAAAVQLPHVECQQKATNFVQVDGHVIINERCEKSIELLSKHTTVVPVCIEQLLAYGGGVACATGIIQDQLPAANEMWWEDAEEEI